VAAEGDLSVGHLLVLLLLLLRLVDQLLQVALQPLRRLQRVLA